MDMFESQFKGYPKRTLASLITSTTKVRDKQYPTNAVMNVDYKYVLQNKQLYIKSNVVPWSTDRKIPFALSMIIDRVQTTEVGNAPFNEIIYYYLNPKEKILLKKPSFDNTCRVRCQCKDFYFMWSYYDQKNKALVGTHKPYIRLTDTYPERNPTHSPGLCKHLLVFIKKLVDTKIIDDNYNILNSYLTVRKINGK